MEPKSFLLSKTLWTNLLGVPLFAWLVRHGVEVDPATQDQIILGFISLVNVALRFVTNRGLALPGKGTGALLLALGLAGSGLSACTEGQLAVAGRAAAALETACQDATAASTLALAVLKGGARDTAAEISAYVEAGCQGSASLAALAADPSSLDWVEGLASTIRALIAAGEAAP